MARITFKQFIQIDESNDGADFVSAPLELVPKKKIVDPNTNQLIKNPDYTKWKSRNLSLASDSEKLKIDLSEPTKTEFDAKEIPKIVTSGGRAKEEALKKLTQPKTNEYFWQGLNYFAYAPQVYTPSSMIKGR